jgi:hypothetical protein
MTRTSPFAGSFRPISITSRRAAILVWIVFVELEGLLSRSAVSSRRPSRTASQIATSGPKYQISRRRYRTCPQM